MSLIVAGVCKGCVWMISDAAITGGPISLRDRHFLPKIVTSATALVGFAGAPEHGLASARKAAEASISDAIEILRTGSKDSHVEFAYACSDEDPKLFHIADGVAEQRATMFLGLQEAFEAFQRARHGELNRYAPKAVKRLYCRANENVPDELHSAIHAMIDVFTSREDHDVGGWAVPYFLTQHGTKFCSYAYSVSDPVLDDLIPGSILGHGTAPGGGSTLSVTEVHQSQGMVVYWLQRPGGTVWLQADGYAQHYFDGDPSAFKKSVKDSLNLDVDLLVGEAEPGALKRIIVLRGEDGNLTETIADYGNALSFAVHSTGKPYISKASFGDQPLAMPAYLNVNKVSDSEVELHVNDATVNLDAKSLSDLISVLAKLRSEMSPVVPMEIDGQNTLCQTDPAWRTFPSLHPDLKGLTLNFRHSGYGWITFVMPDYECRNFGEWLLDNAKGEVPPAA